MSTSWCVLNRVDGKLGLFYFTTLDATSSTLEKLILFIKYFSHKLISQFHSPINSILAPFEP